MKKSNNKKTENQIFIGLAHVVTNKAAGGVLKSSKGAYVNILCLVSNETEFIVEASKVMKSMGLNLVDCEDIETFTERMEKYEIQDRLLSLAKQVNDEQKVIFGTFHSYK